MCFGLIIILKKSHKSLLVPSTFRGTHFIASFYLHIAPEENPEYILHYLYGHKQPWDIYYF